MGLQDVEDFSLFLVAERVKEQRQMAFFLLCVSVRGGGGERESKDKKWSEMCAVRCFFPRTEVSGGLIFLTAVRPG